MLVVRPDIPVWRPCIKPAVVSFFVALSRATENGLCTRPLDDEIEPTETSTVTFVTRVTPPPDESGVTVIVAPGGSLSLANIGSAAAGPLCVIMNSRESVPPLDEIRPADHDDFTPAGAG